MHGAAALQASLYSYIDKEKENYTDLIVAAHQADYQSNFGV